MAGGAAAGALTAPVPDDGTSVRPVVTSVVRDDDAAIRALLRASVIPGAVRVAFTREPDYFAGDALAGGEDHAVVARHGGRLVGLGRCSVYPLFRNGAPARVAYLGELRLAPGTANGVRLLRDGYAALAESVGEVEACFTSITNDNVRARSVLERGGRLGLPAYAPIASLVTLVAPVAPVALVAPAAPLAPAAGFAMAAPVRSAHPPHHVAAGGADRRADVADGLAFLARHAPDRQLALQWDDDRLARLARHGFTGDDLVIVRRGGAVVAAGGIWDQRPFRQVVVDGYAAALQLARPAVNLWCRLTRRPALPPPGSVLAQGALLGATVSAPGDWRVLWPALQACARARGIAWLTVARDARDPELPVLRALTRAREYHTTLYDVALGRRSPAAAWDSRLVRPEVGLL
ncbi:MAG: hypothetical protein IT359_15805 [Gemmatimonadaceae bacterium]|nr:hypothetical protein [Gemmatimonadaceae bacterium]